MVSSSLTWKVPFELKPPIEEPVPKKTRQQTQVDLEDRLLADRVEDESKHSVPTFVGIDLGRAKLFHSSIQMAEEKTELIQMAEDGNELVRTVPPSEAIKSCVFTRRQHYWNIRYKGRKKQNQTSLVEQLANTELSEAGKKKNLLWYVRAQRDNANVTVSEKIKDKRSAKLSMVKYRLRQSSLRLATERLLRCAARDGSRLVIGLGSASVQPGGVGQLSSPTSAIRRTLNESIRAAERQAKDRGVWRPIEVLNIDEYKTSVSCYRCGSQTTSPHVRKMTKKGVKTRASSRLKECDNCGKRVDRDKQGSRNMLDLTIRKYYGIHRPDYLKRQPRA